MSRLNVIEQGSGTKENHTYIHEEIIPRKCHLQTATIVALYKSRL